MVRQPLDYTEHIGELALWVMYSQVPQRLGVSGLHGNRGRKQVGWHLPQKLRRTRPVSPQPLDISVSVHQAKNVRTTVTLDDDIYEAAMHLSRASGERLGKVLSRLARRGLKPADAPARRSRRRFPVFDVPANAPVIPASRIQRVIDEEGLF